jgi:hypothetical protein
MEENMARTPSATRRIALVADDHKSRISANGRIIIANCRPPCPLCHRYATATADRMPISELMLRVTCLRSGPLGGDRQPGDSPGTGASLRPAHKRPKSRITGEKCIRARKPARLAIPLDGRPGTAYSY